MKTRIVIGSLMATLVVFQAWAQRAENDDMYFNSKDRQKLKSETASISVNDKIDSDYKAFKKKHFDGDTEEQAENVNPTDSYSSRNVNPEFVSRSNSEQASEDEQNYYVEDYTANTYDSYSSPNYRNYDNYSNWNYNNSFYGPSYRSWYSPYCGYCDPWRNPYYGGSGWSFSVGYMWGNPWNNGWGSPFYDPFYGYYSPYSSPYYSGWGYPGYYYYPGTEVTRGNYGKRPSRHSAVVTPGQRSSQQRMSSNNTNDRVNRSRQTTDEYYVKPSRRTSTFDNSSRDRYTRPSSNDDFFRPTRTRESSPSSRPSYSPSRSSGSSSAPSRSSGSSSGSSGSRRGRN